MAKLSGKLSVLMPAYNEEAIIYENALEAARQISPLADDYELLVIDDGSSDRTKAGDRARRSRESEDPLHQLPAQPGQGRRAARGHGPRHG